MSYQTSDQLKIIDDDDIHSLAENDFEDSDTCLPEELDKLFKIKYNIHDQLGVTNDDSYVLSLAKDDSFTCVAAGLSDGSVRLFELNSERGIYIEPPEITKRLNTCGLRFVDESPNLLLVGTTNGLVRLLDLRTKSEAKCFRNIPDNKCDPLQILSFDLNASGRLLAMGTVQYGTDVNILFYDFRTANKLFKYMESHQDDLTSLRFHPKNPNLLCTGSTDNLINIFNVNETHEGDAILATVNTENTVQKVDWHKNSNDQDIVSCITHTNGFKAYSFDGRKIMDFDRLKITETIKRTNESNWNLINCHSTVDNGMMLLTGCNSDNGSILRSCKVQNEQILPYANFEGNGQIIRESIFDAKTKILITAGEKGCVTLWTPLTCRSAVPSSSTSSSCTLKMKTKKSNKIAPY